MTDRIEEIKKFDLRDFLQKYEGHEFIGDKTLCPFHDDHEPSMTVGQKDGNGVFFCHSCHKGGSLIDYYILKHGLSISEAIKEVSQKIGIEKPVPRIVAEYPYMDEQGKLLYKVLRYQPKDFRADRKMSTVRQVLYRLPAVLAGDPVWLLEGEKDTDNVSKLGLVATTAAFGVSHWKAVFSEFFKGKRVRICLDVGYRREAERRARDIARVAREVKIIELPGLEKDEDISDWISLHDAQCAEDLKAQLEKMAEETPVFIPPEEDAEALTVEEFGVLQIPKIDWLVKPIVERFGYTIIGAQKGVGKSLFVTQLALYAAAGISPFLIDDLTIPKAIRVLLIQQEVSLPGMQDRLFKMRSEQIFDLGGRFRQKTTTGRWWNLSADEDYDKLVALLKKYSPDLLILDPLYTFWPKELNTVGDISPMMQIISELKTNFNLGLIIVHHFSNKEDPDSPKIAVGRFMGHSVIANSADTTIGLDFLHPKYKQARLPLPYQNYISTEITTRHGEWPANFCAERRQGGLLFRRSTIWQDLGRSIVPEEIEEIIKAHGGEMMQKDLIDTLLPRAARVTIVRAIGECEDRGSINKTPLPGRGKPVLLRLKTWIGSL